MKTLQIGLLEPNQFSILFETCDEVDEWVPQLAQNLGVSDEELKDMLDELRIFFVLVIFTINAKAFLPTNPAPFEPPPPLKRLWSAMAADEIRYNKFLAVTELDERFNFCQDYPLKRRLSPEKAQTLLRQAGYLGLPIKPQYWELT